MARPPPSTSRSLALGALAVLVLALLLSLLLLLGRGGCAPAIAFERPIAQDPPRAPLELAGTSTRTSAEASRDTRPRIGSSRGAAAIELGSVRGVVADAVTRELVPHVEVELRCEGRKEIVLVGEDATFATVAGLPSGDLEAVVRDDGVEVGRATIAHDAGAGTRGWRVEVPIGPTIRIASVDRLPFPPERWRARIRESALDDRVAGEIDVGADGLSMAAPSADLPDRDWPFLALRPGPTPWARYPRVVFPPVKGVEARVELRDDEQNRKGRAKLRGTLGIQPAVDVPAESFGRLVYTIQRDKKHASSPMRAVLFDAKEPASGAALGFEEKPVASDGAVDFADVEPGQKTLVAWSRTEFVEDRVLVSEGPTLKERGKADVVGRPGDGAMPLPRRDLVPYGWSGEPERLVIAPRDARYGRESTTRLRAWILPDGADPGDVIASMPRLGEREVRFLTIARVLPEPGAHYAHEKLVRYGFRAVGAATNAPVPARIAFGPTGHVALETARDARADFEAPAEVRIAWSAWASGMQPVFGTSRDFKAQADDARLAEARLEPGVGFEILLRAGDPEEIAKDPWPWPKQFDAGNRAELAALAGAPVAGVRVEIDTYAAGTSGPNGEVRIRHPILPQRITLVAKGWRVCALDPLPGGLPRYVAWLRRNP